MSTGRVPQWLNSAVFYQVYPQSFCDSNGDGIGDLPGLISKLDYIKSLGVDAIWLNPIYVSPFGDAGYDVADFRRIASRYGTNADARRLFREAHKRGLRVVLDLVAGHTSDQHPWFQQACQGPKNPYSDYYIWTDLPSGADAGARRTAKSPGPRKGSYIPNFFKFQPALNYGYMKPDRKRPWEKSWKHPACRRVAQELRAIMEFWLKKGCDGFRVDMASSLIRGDDDGRVLAKFWGEFRRWLERDWPEAVLVSEWGNPRQAIWAGYHIDFMIHFGEPAYQHLVGPLAKVRGKSRDPHAFFERSGKGDICKFLDNYLLHYRATRGRGFISLPTGNHDYHRPTLGRRPDDVRVLFAMLFTMPGVPFLYYGDEIGMWNPTNLLKKEGSMWRTACRTPMQWNEGKNAGFSTAPAGQLYLPVDTRPARPTVSKQEQDPQSLLNFTRRLIALRREYPALGNTGDFRPLYAEAKKIPFVYERRAGRQRMAVAVNPSEHARTVDLPSLRSARMILAQGASLSGSKLTMPGVSFAIMGF